MASHPDYRARAVWGPIPPSRFILDFRARCRWLPIAIGHRFIGVCI